MLKRALSRVVCGVASGAIVVSAAACVTACSFESAQAGETLGTASEDIVKGKDSDASQDAVVMIMISDPGVRLAFCTGTLITSRLVLTARHCVSVTDEGADCNTAGSAKSGGRVFSDKPVSQFFIFKGVNAPDLSAPTFVADAKAQKIITDGTPNFCNHDIALIELDRELKDQKTMPVRLDGTVMKGEQITAVGWGYTDSGQLATIRQQRTGVGIVTVGPAAETTGDIAPNEFEVGESFCSGDSGGPAIASTGALVGVASRGGNGTTPAGNPAAACEGADTLNLYTRPAPFKDFLVKAAKGLGQNVWAEGQPDPSKASANGATCGKDSDCQSLHCGPAQTCAADCSVLSCASGYTCDAKQECVKAASAAPPKKSGGCSASPAPSALPGAAFASDAGPLLVGLGALAFVRRRRRARVSEA
jgi:hypothetical protein